MEKIQTQLQQQSFIQNANFIEHFKIEVEQLSVNKIKKTHKDLNTLCMDFDPYQGENVGAEVEALLTKYSLDNFTSNPFLFTNVVLQMLDIIETEIQNRSN